MHIAGDAHATARTLMNQLLRFVAVAALALSTRALAAPDSCRMPSDFDDPHLVIHDKTNALFWVRPMQVDADGSANAYHRDDPHGNKGLAIEYLGNGMTIFRDGEPLEFKLDEKDNGEWLSAYWSIVENGWKAPPGLTVDIYGVAKNRQGDVCVGPRGQLVSATSLSRRTVPDLCSQRRYFNALRFPGIVVPNRSDDEHSVANADPEVAPPFAIRGVRRGDLAIAYNPSTGIWQGAFLYDTGPRELLGEGSIRLVMNLTGRKEVPTSAIETNSMGLVETFVLLFPRSVRDLGPEREWTPERIERAAARRFRQWGGGSITNALKRLFACAETYRAQRP